MTLDEPFHAFKSLWNVGNSSASYTKLFAQSGNRKDAARAKQKGLRTGKRINSPRPYSVTAGAGTMSWRDRRSCFYVLTEPGWLVLKLIMFCSSTDLIYAVGTGSGVSEGPRAGGKGRTGLLGCANPSPCRTAAWEKSTGLNCTTEITSPTLAKSLFAASRITSRAQNHRSHR